MTQQLFTRLSWKQRYDLDGDGRGGLTFALVFAEEEESRLIEKVFSLLLESDVYAIEINRYPDAESREVR